jgi:haloalkane dehalogenase
MDPEEIKATDDLPRRVSFLKNSTMSYVDDGVGKPVVFLHGNPTSSYLWRNIIPHVSSNYRCLAPDLIGMGASGPSETGKYRFTDHAVYFQTWMDSLELSEKVVLVGHDWGSALIFDWASRHQDYVEGIVYMEAIVRPLTWDEWPEAARRIFQGIRSEAGEELILEKNVFIESILPASVIRDLLPQEMDAYRRPFQNPGPSRMPTLAWPREIPIGDHPPDMVRLVDGYANWLAISNIPKLFINATPGSILTGRQREFCRSWSNQIEISVPGRHFIQEDSPHEIGRAIRAWLDTKLFC